MAQADLLYRNNGDGTFTEVSRGGFEAPDGRGLGLAIADFEATASSTSLSPTMRLLTSCSGTWVDSISRRSGKGGSRRQRLRVRNRPAWVWWPMISTVMARSISSSPTSSTNPARFSGTSVAICASIQPWAPASMPRPAQDGLRGCLGRRRRRWTTRPVRGQRPRRRSPLDQQPDGPAALSSGGEIAIASRWPVRARPIPRASVGRGVAAGDLDHYGRVDLVVVHRDTAAGLCYNKRRQLPLARRQDPRSWLGQNSGQDGR